MENKTLARLKERHAFRQAEALAHKSAEELRQQELAFIFLPIFRMWEDVKDLPALCYGDATPHKVSDHLLSDVGHAWCKLHLADNNGNGRLWIYAAHTDTYAAVIKCRTHLDTHGVIITPERAQELLLEFLESIVDPEALS